MEAHYQTNVFRYRDTNGTAKTFDQVKDQIRAEFRDETAARIGFQKATEFGNELFKLAGQSNRAEILIQLAARKGLPVRVTEPFTEFEGPKLTNAPANFGRTAFQLSADEALGQMLPGIDGVYFIAFKDRLKPEDPPFAQVRAKVVEDYRRSQATELTLTEGTKLVQAATNALAAGKSFKDAAKGLGLVALEVPPFSRNAQKIEIVQDRGIGIEEFRDQAFALAPGKVSGFRSVGMGGFVVYVKGFTPVADDQVKAELPKFAESLRENRSNYAFREWLGREVERSGVMAPLRQQAKGAAAGAGQ
jgi:PPIC-type PPIASE domain